MENSQFGLMQGITKSIVESGNYDKESDLTKFAADSKIDNALYIAYMYDGIVIGKFEGKFKNYQNKDITTDQLLRLRVFNQNKELHLWKTDDEFKYRLREDTVDKGNDEYIEADQVLFGTYTEPIGTDYIKLKEDRGTEIVLPFTFQIDKGASPENRIKIRTRNYIDYIDNHASYVDTRFVEFIGIDNKPLEGGK